MAVVRGCGGGVWWWSVGGVVVGGEAGQAGRVDDGHGGIVGCTPLPAAAVWRLACGITGGVDIYSTPHSKYHSQSMRDH